MGIGGGGRTPSLSFCLLFASVAIPSTSSLGSVHVKHSRRRRHHRAHARGCHTTWSKHTPTHAKTQTQAQPGHPWATWYAAVAFTACSRCRRPPFCIHTSHVTPSSASNHSQLDASLNKSTSAQRHLLSPFVFCFHAAKRLTWRRRAGAVSRAKWTAPQTRDEAGAKGAGNGWAGPRSGRASDSVRRTHIHTK